MGKRSQRQSHVRCEKSGCMWSLISMLDFRYGRFTQKMLLDRRYASRSHAAGAEKQKVMHDIDIDAHDQYDEENMVVRRSRPSVKELIEEDLLDEQLSMSETKCAEVKLILEGNQRSDTKRTRHKKGFQVHGETDVACDAIELTCPHNSEAFMFMYDNEMDKKRMEELSLQKSTSQRSTDEFEGKRKEVTKLLGSQKVKHRMHQEQDDGVDHQSQELKDALQITCFDERLFIKVLQGQGNVRVENEEESKSPLAAEQRQCVSKQINQVSTTKHGKYVRRKSKYLETTVSKGNVSRQEPNRIVILKPGHKGLQDSETKNGKHSSHFSLTEIKRRLRNVMGRERQEGSTTSKRYPNEPIWAGKQGDRRRSRESGSGRKGPSKEHFFLEKITRYPLSSRKGENGAKSFESEELKEQQVDNILHKPRRSNIYFDAKNHLSKILTNGPKPLGLGRILSVPEYNSSSCGSSGSNLWYGFIPARMSLPNIENCHRLESQVGRISLSSELSDDIIADNKAHVACGPSSIIPEEPVHDSGEKNVNEGTMEGGLEIEKATEIIMSSEERGGSDLFEHECSPSTSRSKSCPSLEPKEMQGRSSPLCVLEPLFKDNDISPTTSLSAMQPLRIQFEEFDSSHGDDDIHMKGGIEERDFIFEFIKSVLLASGLNWEELYLVSDSLDQILDPSSCDEFQFFPNQLCSQKQLLFDCTDEALVEVYERYFSCSPGFSLATPSIRPVPDMENTIHEVWERVHCYLMPFSLPHTLEKIVKRDMDINISWMELRRDIQAVIVEIGEAISEELIEGTILSCVDKVRREKES